MLMFQIRRSLVPFLITTLLLQGFLPIAGNNRKILKNFVDEVLVHCSNPDHSHPPMIPSDGKKKAKVFYLTQQDPSPTILWLPLIFKFQIAEKACKYPSHVPVQRPVPDTAGVDSVGTPKS